MNSPRTTRILTAHALAEGRPLGKLLRAIDKPWAQAAAGEVEAGRLSTGLGYLQFPTDLTHLAEVCPAALASARRRVARLPSPFYFQLPLLTTFGYLFLIGLFQVAVAHVLDGLMLDEMSPFDSVGVGFFEGLRWVASPGMATALCLVFVAGGLVAFFRPGRLDGWSGHLQRAREASLAAALAEVNAPIDAHRALYARFSAFRATPMLVPVAELELVVDSTLLRATQLQQRAVSTVRLLGITALILVAAVMTGCWYGLFANLAGAI